MMNNMLKTMMGYLYDPYGIQFATVRNSYDTVLLLYSEFQQNISSKTTVFHYSWTWC